MHATRKPPINVAYLSDQIGNDAAQVLHNMAPELASEARQIENAVDRISNLLSDSLSPPDAASIISFQICSLPNLE